MNYYIQGNKDKAEEIKAAFEKIGCDVTGFDMCNDKELELPKPHYDISNFKPFDKVLVRDCNHNVWRCGWFSHYNDKEIGYPFVTTSSTYKQCIPFEGNEHLLGTTDMCDEMYINW